MTGRFSPPLALYRKQSAQAKGSGVKRAVTRLEDSPNLGQEMFCIYRLHADGLSKTLIRAAPRYPRCASKRLAWYLAQSRAGRFP
jgi:hypothetical protein